jgi:hypothetical protein
VSQSGGMAASKKRRRKLDKNAALVSLTLIEIVALLTILSCLREAVAVIASSILLVIVSTMTILLALSVLYKGLGDRKLSATSITFVVSTVTINLLFANLYRWIGLRDTGLPIVKCDTLSFGDSAYFSIVTWTTLGYGDIAPCPNDRLIAAAEAVVGYLVMALLVAVLVPVLQKAPIRKNISLPSGSRTEPASLRTDSSGGARPEPASGPSGAL